MKVVSKLDVPRDRAQATRQFGAKATATSGTHQRIVAAPVVSMFGGESSASVPPAPPDGREHSGAHLLSDGFALRGVQTNEPVSTVQGVRQRIAQLELELADLRERLRTAEAERESEESAAPWSGSDAPTVAELPSVPQADEEPVPVPERASLPALEFPDGDVSWRAFAFEPAAAGKRAAARQPCELEAEFTDSTYLFAGLAQNICEGGVFLATYCVHAVGTRVSMSFELPGGSAIQACGEVRWIRDASDHARPGMGIAFTELPASSAAVLASFCRRRPPLYMEI